MKILIEGYAYSPALVRGVLSENRLLLTDERVVIENVGYFHSSTCNDFVFFLPKVLLEKVDGVDGDRVFVSDENRTGFSPEEIVDPEAITNEGRKLTEEQKAFLYEFAVWIYRAIAQFKEKNPRTTVVWQHRAHPTGAFKRRYITNTFLDVILALQRFHRENETFFLFKVRESHVGGYKINWGRTVTKAQSVIRDGVPVYFAPIRKRHSIDFDEELLVIFYSILHYVKAKFGFRIQLNLGYSLITGQQFKRYLDGYGIVRLRQIRNRYFSDREKMLWELCFAFFDKAHKASIVGAEEEYLLAKDFNIVFEAMIDELVGDSRVAKFRQLADGKEIDHLYLDKSLTRNEETAQTFYVADSKYYKRGNALGEESVAKQFTYARNLLQLDLDLFLNGDDVSEKIKNKRTALENVGLLRDSTTEGYDIIPNFFISATLPKNFNYDCDCLALHGDAEAFRNIHFENRLFDRDTLLLSHYDINFLYVVKMYAHNDTSLKKAWRKKVRDEFRLHIQTLLKERFEFYAMVPHNSISEEKAIAFLRENFKLALGKLYAPYPKLDGKTVYSLALENPEMSYDDGKLSDEGLKSKKARLKAENEEVVHVLKQIFCIIPCELGENPIPSLRQKILEGPNNGTMEAGTVAETGVIVATGYSKGYISAVRHAGWCPWSVTACRNPSHVKCIIFPHTNQADMFIVNSQLPHKGPLNASEVRQLLSEFENVQLQEGDYYVWPILDAKT